MSETYDLTWSYITMRETYNISWSYITMSETYTTDKVAYVLPTRRLLVPGRTAGSEPEAGVVVHYDG